MKNVGKVLGHVVGVLLGTSIVAVMASCLIGMGIIGFATVANSWNNLFGDVIQYDDALLLLSLVVALLSAWKEIKR